MMPDIFRHLLRRSRRGKGCPILKMIESSSRGTVPITKVSPARTRILMSAYRGRFEYGIEVGRPARVLVIDHTQGRDSKPFQSRPKLFAQKRSRIASPRKVPEAWHLSECRDKLPLERNRPLGGHRGIGSASVSIARDA